MAISTMMKKLSMAAAGATFISLGAFGANPVQAATVFSQNFESGLGANETTFGSFAINSSNNAINNGTQMMGHPAAYGDNEYSYYDLALDLTAFRSTQLAFDFLASFETHFDRFNVLASTTPISPPSGVLVPTSGMTYIFNDHAHRPELGLTYYDTSVERSGRAVFDLSAFDGQLVNLRFQFGSDFSVISSGINIDNILVTAESVPEPTSTLGLLALGTLGAGSMLKRKQQKNSTEKA